MAVRGVGAPCTVRELPRASSAIGEELAQAGSTFVRTLVEGSPHQLDPTVKGEAHRVARAARLHAASGER